MAEGLWLTFQVLAVLFAWVWLQGCRSDFEPRGEAEMLKIFLKESTEMLIPNGCKRVFAVTED